MRDSRSCQHGHESAHAKGAREVSNTTRTMGTRFGIGTGLILAVLAVPLGMATAGTDQPGWRKALHARSEALNREYGLGNPALRTLSLASPDWQQGLRARSEGLNLKYGLGGSTIRTLSVASPDWQQGLRVRSEGLNLEYGLAGSTIG
jgi:hypothetical protein